MRLLGPPKLPKHGYQFGKKGRFLGIFSIYELYFWLAGTEKNENHSPSQIKIFIVVVSAATAVGMTVQKFIVVVVVNGSTTCNYDCSMFHRDDDDDDDDEDDDGGKKLR